MDIYEVLGKLYEEKDWKIYLSNGFAIEENGNYDFTHYDVKGYFDIYKDKEVLPVVAKLTDTVDPEKIEWHWEDVDPRYSDGDQYWSIGMEDAKIPPLNLELKFIDPDAFADVELDTDKVKSILGVTDEEFEILKKEIIEKASELLKSNIEDDLVNYDSYWPNSELDADDYWEL